MGAFCRVSEIRSIVLLNGDGQKGDKEEEEGEEGGKETPTRSYMSANVLRGKSGVSRYAIKALKTDLNDDTMACGVTDLAIERKFLSVLIHPNIIKMRGYSASGSSTSRKMFLVLDRLYDTLEERMATWEARRGRNARIGATEMTMACLKGGCLPGRKGSRRGGGRMKGPSEMDMLLLDRIMVAYDIASVFRYLHGHE